MEVSSTPMETAMVSQVVVSQLVAFHHPVVFHHLPSQSPDLETPHQHENVIPQKVVLLDLIDRFVLRFYMK